MQKLDDIKIKIKNVLEKYPVKEAGLFGSFARGEERKDSDIDIMIRLEPNTTFSLYDLVDIEEELKKELGREVDLFTEKSIDKYIRKYVMRDFYPVYQR